MQAKTEHLEFLRGRMIRRIRPTVRVIVRMSRCATRVKDLAERRNSITVVLEELRDCGEITRAMEMTPVMVRLIVEFGGIGTTTGQERSATRTTHRLVRESAEEGGGRGGGRRRR